MEISQGDVYWYESPDLGGAELRGRRPVVVIQNDLVNRSGIRTTVVCSLTSNINRGRIPGNVTLAIGEGNLEKPSVINVTQILTVDKEKLRDIIGKISQSRMEEVLSGIRRITEPRAPRPRR